MVCLVALSMVRNEEYWIWYSLTSVLPHVDRILVFDNFSEDSTRDVVRGMEHLGDKLTLTERFGTEDENENRERCLEVARRVGGTHVLFLDGDEVHSDHDLGFARRLLETCEHNPPLNDPPRNDSGPGDHTPTDGALVKNIGFKPVHAGYGDVRSSIEADFTQSDHDHGCYNFAIRIASLENLRGNGLDWGRHGYVETGDCYIQSSPYTLWCPGLHYYHLTHHPRSSRRDPGAHSWVREPRDLGSKPLPNSVETPSVLFRPDGPSNPTLEAWGLR